MSDNDDVDFEETDGSQAGVALMAWAVLKGNATGSYWFHTVDHARDLCNRNEDSTSGNNDVTT